MHPATARYSNFSILISEIFPFLQDMAALYRSVFREFNPCRTIWQIDSGTSKSCAATDILLPIKIEYEIVPESMYPVEVGDGPG